MAPLLSIRNLTVEYAVGGKSLFAVSDVSLHVDRGEVLAVIGGPPPMQPALTGPSTQTSPETESLAA